MRWNLFKSVSELEKRKKNAVLLMMNCWSGDVAIKRRTFGIYILKIYIRDIHFEVNLTEDQQKEMMKILDTYKGVLTNVPGKSNLIEHRIILNNEDPVRSKSYPLPYAA